MSFSLASARRAGLFSSLLLVALLAATAPAEVAGQEPISRAADLLEAYHETRRFDGAALVARGDSVLLARGFGEADRAWGIPNGPDVRYRIGSVTKQFTAALVLRLAEEGKLALDSTVSTYLPDYPSPQGEEIALHHLLTHTSGIPSYTGFPDFGERWMRNPVTPDSLVSVFSPMELEFEPGTDWNYSNSGYFLLGYVVERVTGQAYEEALRERVLAPLGLEDTGYDRHADVLERRAEGYVRTPAGFERADYLDTSLPYAAGSLYSTVRDLFRWTRALHGGEVFDDPASYERMTAPYRQDYGYGLVVGAIQPGPEADSVRYVGHGGGINGFTSQVQYFPGSGYTLVLLDNSSSGSVNQLATGLAVALHGGEPEEPKPRIADVLHEVIEEEGVETAVARYRTLKDTAAARYDFSESELNRLGYFFLRRGDTGTAIALFELNVEVFPEAYNTYDSLGEAYMEAGERELAIRNYRKSLELNPANENAREKLREMGVEVERDRVELAPTLLERYVGTYRVALGSGFEIPVRRRDGALEARLPGSSWSELLPRSETQFVLSGFPVQLEFEVEDGEVRGMTLITPDGERVPGERVEGESE